MKSGVKNGNVWHFFAEDLAAGIDALNVCGIIQRSEFNALFDIAQNFARYQNGCLKLFAAVNDAMADGVNICLAFDCIDLGFLRDHPV